MGGWCFTPPSCSYLTEMYNGGYLSGGTSQKMYKGDYLTEMDKKAYLIAMDKGVRRGEYLIEMHNGGLGVSLLRHAVLPHRDVQGGLPHRDVQGLEGLPHIDVQWGAWCFAAPSCCLTSQRCTRGVTSQRCTRFRRFTSYRCTMGGLVFRCSVMLSDLTEMDKKAYLT